MLPLHVKDVNISAMKLIYVVEDHDAIRDGVVRYLEISGYDARGLATIAEERKAIEQEKPDYIIPEIEAIATDELVALEQEGYNVIPTANAARLTMNREGIRRLAAETLGLPTSRYAFASAIGVSEFASDREYSRPTFCTSGFCASIMSRINSVFSASDVPVT